MPTVNRTRRCAYIMFLGSPTSGFAVNLMRNVQENLLVSRKLFSFIRYPLPRTVLMILILCGA